MHSKTLVKIGKGGSIEIPAKILAHFTNTDKAEFIFIAIENENPKTVVVRGKNC